MPEMPEIREILVHAAAPSHGPDDVRYRREAQGILLFEAVKRHDVLPLVREDKKDVASSQRSEIEGLEVSQESAVHESFISTDSVPQENLTDAFDEWTSPAPVHDSLISKGTVPKHHVTDAFKEWLSPVFAPDQPVTNNPAPQQPLKSAITKWAARVVPHHSPRILVRGTPARLHLTRNFNQSSSFLVERTPPDQWRPRTAPSGPSFIQDTPQLKRSFSDSFEAPPSVIPDSQPAMSFKNGHEKLAPQGSSSPSPTRPQASTPKRRKTTIEIEELTQPEDTSMPFCGDSPPTNPPPSDEAEMTLPEHPRAPSPTNDSEIPSSPHFSSFNLRQSSSPRLPDGSQLLPPTSSQPLPQTPTPALPPSSSPPAVPSVYTPNPTQLYRRFKAEVPLVPCGPRRQWTTHLTRPLNIIAQTAPTILASVTPTRPIDDWDRGAWTFDIDDSWSFDDRAMMWDFLHEFISDGRGGIAMMALFYEGTRKEIAIGEGETYDEAVHGVADERFGRVKVFCYGETVRETWGMLVVATKRKVKRVEAKWMCGNEVVVTMPAVKRPHPAPEGLDWN
ncbi:MAG: hypothetical protein Q9174_004495 [Haloplaca sp. 1 TL-2023]